MPWPGWLRVRPWPARARIYVSDGSAFFNRPGPRLVESLEIMAACIHPDSFVDFAKKHADVIRPILERAPDGGGVRAERQSQ